MIQTRLPVLSEDASRLDWTLARYAVKVDVKGGRAFVTHQLDEAPELDRLLEEGAAEWVTELRCPRTLLSRPERSRGSEQVIDLGAEDVVGDAFLVPGLVAVRNLKLQVSGLDPLVWPPDTNVSVPVGWWLVRGDPQTTTPLTASFVRFRRDLDGRLAPGQMSVEEDSDGGKAVLQGHSRSRPLSEAPDRPRHSDSGPDWRVWDAPSQFPGQRGRKRFPPGRVAASCQVGGRRGP